MMCIFWEVLALSAPTLVCLTLWLVARREADQFRKEQEDAESARMQARYATKVTTEEYVEALKEDAREVMRNYEAEPGGFTRHDLLHHMKSSLYLLEQLRLQSGSEADALRDSAFVKICLVQLGFKKLCAQAGQDGTQSQTEPCAAPQPIWEI